ncbi:MAG: radical SAM protein [Prevotellaceae bacterium]|jgi:uncharacterized protein|nr:radical SAM protein [Prevotellaceae bacterium]
MLFLDLFIFLFLQNKDHLVYCSRSNSFLKLSEVFFDFLKQCKENTSLILQIDENLLSLLEKHKIIVNEDDDNNFLLEHEFAENQSSYLYSSFGLVLVPTMACNFDCSYCFEKGKRASKMSDEVIDNLICFIKKHDEAKKLSITWYGGEPLLAVDIIEKILKKIHSEISIPLSGQTIVTNGYYFDSKAIDLFQKYPLKSIQITLDGNKERHNSIRKQKTTGEGSFDRLIENMDKIVKELPETKLSIRVNVEKENLKDYFDLQKKLSERWEGHKIVIYPGFLKIHNDTNTALTCDCIDNVEAHELFFHLRKTKMLDESVYPVLQNTRGCCATVINSYIIGTEGEIYKCWDDVTDNNKIIGYINEEKLTNPSLFYRYVVGSKWYHNEECMNCFFLPICRGQCACYRLRNMYENGKYNLCQCAQKTPNLLNETLEYWYDNQIENKK